MLKVTAGDYAIAKMGSEDGKGKPFLFKVTGVHKSNITGVLAKDAHLSQKRQAVDVHANNLIALLGDDPHPGKSFGCDTSMVFRGRKTHDAWGSICWFYRPEKEVGQQLMQAFDKTARVINKAGLGFAIDPVQCVWEIVVYNGEKFAGMYKRSSKPDKSPHRYQIRPEIMPATDFPYVIYHEFGHHVHMEYVTGRKLNAAWVRLFNSTIKVTSIKREVAQQLLDDLLANPDNRPSDFKSNLSEDDEVAYKLILRQISRDYSLSPKELDLLFEAEYYDDIRAIWPTRGISKKDLEPLVTEYATKHVKELIAESIAYRLSGKKLPREVEALVDKTFSYAKANHEKR